MAGTEDVREILTADVALLSGEVPARDVAAALQRYWDRRHEEGVSVLGELRRIADLSDETAARIRAEVDRLVESARGDPRLALLARGGGASIHAAMGRAVAEAPAASGAGPRSALREVPEDRYVDFRPVGAGGMGIVYWALDTEMNRAVAFKVVRPGATGTGDPTETLKPPSHLTPPPPDTDASAAFEELRARFLQEAWVTGGMEHPGVVPVYEMGQTSTGIPYYTMRFVRGGRSLAKAIAEAKGRPFDDRMALLEPFLKICDTIRYAHARHVVHRDLKPENVALGEFGEVVVLDWGLAKVKESPDLTGTRWRSRVQQLREAGEVRTLAGAMGTPGYMAPEAARGELESVDEQSDVYSLGAILYEILTGRLPFPFRSFVEYAEQVVSKDPPAARDLDPGVPQALSDVAARALARDRSARTRTVDALASALRAWQAQSAQDREVETQLAEARAAVAAARGLSGELLLGQLDHARTALAQVASRRPGHDEAERLSREVRDLYERGLVERERLARRSLLRRIAVAAVLVLAVGGAVVAWMLERRRQEAEDAAARAQAAERVASEERDRARAESARADREAAEARRQETEARRLEGIATERAEEARRALKRARVQALVNASAEASHGDSMLALLLATEAVRREPIPAALSRLETALVQTLERRRYDGHRGPVATAVFDPEGQSVLSSSADGTAHLWQAFGAGADVVYAGHEGACGSARFSRDGARVLTTGDDETARLFRRDGTVLTVLADHAKGEPVADLSADGALVATGDAAGALRVFRDDGTLVGTGLGHEEAVLDVAVSPAGDRVVTASHDGTARVWSAEAKLLHVLRGHEAAVTEVRWSPSGDAIATGAADGSLLLWGPDGQEVAACVGHQGRITDLAFSQDGTRLLSGSADGTARLWDAAGTLLANLVGHQAPVMCVAFAAGGGALVTGSNDYTARLWTPDGRLRARFLGHEREVVTVAWNPRFQALVTASLDGTARVWEPYGEGAGTFRHGDTKVQHATILPGVGVLTATEDGFARLWNFEGTESRPFEGHTGSVRHVAASPRGDRVATASYDGTARVYDLEGEGVAVLRGHGAGVRTVAFDPAAERYLTASDDRTACLWSAEGDLLATLRGHQGAVRCGTFSPAGDRIATCSDDGTVRLWTRDGQRAGLFRGSRSMLLWVSFSPAGDRVATAGADHVARVFDLEGNLQVELRGHRDWVNQVTFSPAGDRIATASYDGTARVWDAAGAEVLVLRGHEASVMSAVFSPQAEYLLTGSEDGLGRLWPLDPATLLRLAEERGTRVLTEEERRRHAELLGDE